MRDDNAGHLFADSVFRAKTLAVLCIYPLPRDSTKNATGIYEENALERHKFDIVESRVGNLLSELHCLVEIFNGVPKVHRTGR